MKIYFVKAGDTLSAIAEKHGVTVDQLLAANPIIADPDDLKVAMKLVIPAAKKDGQGISGKGTEPKPDHSPAAKPGTDAASQGQTGAAAAGKADQDGKTGPMQPGFPPIPALPDFPESWMTPGSGGTPGAADKHPCQSCQSKAGGPAVMPLPYAFPATQPATGGNVPGGYPPAGQPWMMTTVPGPGHVATGPMAGAVQADCPDVQHPFAAIQQPAVPVQAPFGQGVPPVQGAGVSFQPGIGWGTGLPNNWSGFHSPYNTPFSVNPYLMPTEGAGQQASPQGGGGAAFANPGNWQPYRFNQAPAPDFIPPHAAVSTPDSENTATLHRTDDEPEEDEPASRGKTRKKPAAKKRKPAGDLTLKDKILRMQHNHRRY